MEKYYNVVFNLTKTRGGFCNLLEAMKVDIKFYRMIRNIANTAIAVYNGKNDAHYKLGEILNCVRIHAGGLG